MAHDEQDHVDGWVTYYEWSDKVKYASRCIETFESSPEFAEGLLACDTNLNRFEYVWKNNHLKQDLESIYVKQLQSIKNKHSQKSRHKSNEEANRLRGLGNNSFKDSDYISALRYYTLAIKFAPYPKPNSEEKSLALSLANRSAVLYSLKRYRLCLADIDLAIKYGYPNENMFRLTIRKVKCLHILSVWTNDVEQIKDKLRGMLNNCDTNKSIKIEIQNMFEFLENAQPQEMEKDELDVIDETTMKISNMSKTLSQAADCVEMSYDSDKGRYLLTNKDVSLGRLLIVEEPFVSNLAPDLRSEYCYNCFGPLYSCGIGCNNCTRVLYCSESCLEAKADIHVFECDGFLDFQEEIGVAYMVAHIMFKINFDLSSFPVFTKKTFDQKTPEEILRISPSDWPDLVYKNSYASVLSLMDHSKDYTINELMHFSLTAVYLMIAFIDQFAHRCPKLDDSDYQILVGSIILRHLLQLQTNLISIIDQDLQSITANGHSANIVSEKPIGVGIYPTVSLLNHSCGPNIMSIFHRNKFMVRADKSLECGTELNYCYGPSVQSSSKKDRQRLLKNQYFFTCDCNCCRNNIESENKALLCPKCQGPIIYNEDYTHQCKGCHGECLIDVKYTLTQIERLTKDLVIDDNQQMEMDFRMKIERLKNAENELSSLMHWKHSLFATIKSKLIEFAEYTEDLDLILEFCKDKCNLWEKKYGDGSYQSIMAKFKLINTKWEKLYHQTEDSSTDKEKQASIAELKDLQGTINTIKLKLKNLLASTNILGAESTYESELKFLNDINCSINKYLTSLEDGQVPLDQSSDNKAET